MKKNDKVIPFANETKKLKEDFKKSIDNMPDDEFLDMMFFLMNSGLEDDFDDECDCDCDCGCEHEHDYEDIFSGEMINFKCPKCKKISAHPIEIINDIYTATKKEPQIECFYCNSHEASPMYYKAPDNKIFQN